MPINAGLLIHRVSIEKYDYLRDSQGEVIQDQQTGEVSQQWVEVAEVWASIEDYSVREFIQSAATQSQTSTRIVIRADGLVVDASMRVVHLTKDRPPVYYNIHGVQADRQSGREYLTLPCSRGVGEGQ